MVDLIKQCLSSKNFMNCGCQVNFWQDEDGRLILDGQNVIGIFVSQTYDSGKAETEWNRVVMDIARNAVIQVYVYIFEDSAEGEMIDGKEEVQQQLDILKEKAQYTSPYREMLLYGAEGGKGRYAKLAVEIMAEANQDRNAVTGALFQGVILNGYAISFPKESFAQYLPVIYQGNEQLDRFLAVQQSLYLELEQKIDHLAYELDYELCQREQAVTLARWLGWGELAEIAEEDVLRKLLGSGLSLISRKGSKGYYEKLAEILVGQEAVVLEEVEKGRNVLLIKKAPEKGREKYLAWIRRNVPIGIRMDIEILHRTDRLDGLFFLNYTASLAEYGSELAEDGIETDNIRLY